MINFATFSDPTPQYNDYNPKEYVVSDDVDVLYVGHPIDRPKDIRARPFSLFWKGTGRPKRMADSTVVYRATYVCAKNCSDPSAHVSKTAKFNADMTIHDDGSGTDDGSDTDGSDETESQASDSDKGSVIEGGGRGRPPKIKRKCRVQLVVSLTPFHSFCELMGTSRLKSVLGILAPPIYISRVNTDQYKQQKTLLHLISSGKALLNKQVIFVSLLQRS